MLARFEQLMEQAVEGSLRRIFPTTLQPVQIAKAAARAMDAAQVIGISGAQVPNAYRVRLAPQDLTRFADYHATLSHELSTYLVDYAAERGLHPVGEPRIELAEDPTVRTGSVRVDARFVDVEPAQQAALENAIEGTRRLRLADLAAATPLVEPDGPPKTLWLADRLGLRYALDPQAALVRIGRATDNDVAVDNQRVSRYHAQMRWIESDWLVYDLDSTNGTFVDGERVSPDRPRALRAGMQLRLGDHDLSVADHAE
jgi:pSer/pThr/pTyr-binding forkhead associated (FHA) protein